MGSPRWRVRGSSGGEFVARAGSGNQVPQGTRSALRKRTPRNLGCVARGAGRRGPVLRGSGLFEVVYTAHFDWEQIYDAAGYIALLSTFSGHIDMEDSKREYLFAEIRRRLAMRPDKTLRRHWGTVPQVARGVG
jgi:hypothetical protein